MKKTVPMASALRVVLLVACIVGFAGRASAILLDTSSARYLGLINPNQPSSPDLEVDYINYLLTMDLNTTDIDAIGGNDITRSGNTFASLPPAVEEGMVKDETANNTGNFGLGYGYLLGKYDAAKAGALVWYVGGLTGDFEIPATYSGQGLSHVSRYNPGSSVPDGGATVVLFGMAIVALAGLKRLA